MVKDHGSITVKRCGAGSIPAMKALPVTRIQRSAAKAACFCQYDKPRHNAKFFKRQAHKAMRRFRDSDD